MPDDHSQVQHSNIVVLALPLAGTLLLAIASEVLSRVLYSDSDGVSDPSVLEDFANSLKITGSLGVTMTIVVAAISCLAGLAVIRLEGLASAFVKRFHSVSTQVSTINANVDEVKREQMQALESTLTKHTTRLKDPEAPLADEISSFKHDHNKFREGESRGIDK